MSAESVGDELPPPEVWVAGGALKVVVSCEASVGRAAVTETEAEGVAVAMKEVLVKPQVRTISLMSTVVSVSTWS